MYTRIKRIKRTITHSPCHTYDDGARGLKHVVHFLGSVVAERLRATYGESTLETHTVLLNATF